jgi:hypothetical protein
MASAEARAHIGDLGVETPTEFKGKLQTKQDPQPGVPHVSNLLQLRHIKCQHIF